MANGQTTTSRPTWFEQALLQEPASADVQVGGCRIHYLRWGSVGAAPLLLVHGNGAHARWWSFIAPLLASRGRCVAAIDLGGMGDSEEPREQSPDGFADQIAGVAKAIGGSRPVSVVGHSFGGLMSVVAALRHPDLVDRLIVIDTPFRLPPGQELPSRLRSPVKSVYPSREAALARFRLLPEQACENAFIIEFIAQNSIKPVEGGWTWKFGANPWNFPAFDQGIWDRVGRGIAGLPQPIAFIRGQLSTLCPPETEQVWREFAGRDAPIVVIPEARHHVMLDQPIALTGALDALLASFGLRRHG